MPDPVPMSKKDCPRPDLRRATSCRKQNAVVGCCPVPKLKPGSSKTTDCPGCGRLLLHVGLIKSDELISIGLKCRFQDSAQSSRRTSRNEIVARPSLKPQVLIRSSPARSLARLAARQSGFFPKKMVTWVSPVLMFVYEVTGCPKADESNSVTASSASGTVST